MSEIDKRGRLEEAVFTDRAVLDGTVLVAWNGKTVTKLFGKEAERFLAKIPALTDRDARLVKANVTGNFNRGNERR